MDCPETQEAILDFLEQETGEARPLVEAHVANCPDCAAFAERHRRLDARLRESLPVPELSPSFRSVLRRKIAQDKGRAWPDFLPDVVHFASCGAAALGAVTLLPFEPSIVLVASALATTITYLLLLEVRGAFEAIEAPHR
jgi:hypothetical protein